MFLSLTDHFKVINVDTMGNNERRNFFRGGYAKVSFVLNTIFNTFFSLLLIILSITLLLIITLIIKLQDGGPILYKGIRLGLNKKPFVMYKFRTLVPGAEKIIGAEIMTEKQHNHLETASGKFLRETRLDELPQLFNILKGDMDFLGPRPVRPAVYEKFCKNIKGYDKRFSVKPGLIGYSQLFTPHSAPKRIRALIDNKFLSKKQKFMWDTIIIFYTILVVITKIFREIGKYFWNSLLKIKILGRYKEKRTLTRKKIKGARIYIKSNCDKEGIFTDASKLLDINEEAILIHSNSNLEDKELILKMEIDHRTKPWKKCKRKFAICFGELYRASEIENDQFKYSYVIKYTPVSPLNYYRVHEYFLSQSMI